MSAKGSSLFLDDEKKASGRAAAKGYLSLSMIGEHLPKMVRQRATQLSLQSSASNSITLAFSLTAFPNFIACLLFTQLHFPFDSQSPPRLNSLFLFSAVLAQTGHVWLGGRLHPNLPLPQGVEQMGARRRNTTHQELGQSSKQLCCFTSSPSFARTNLISILDCQSSHGFPSISSSSLT